MNELSIDFFSFVCEIDMIFFYNNERLRIYLVRSRIEGGVREKGNL